MLIIYLWPYPFNFYRAESLTEKSLMVSVVEYFESVHNRVCVTFRQKTGKLDSPGHSPAGNDIKLHQPRKNGADVSHDGGAEDSAASFEVVMSRKALYDDVCQLVSDRIQCPGERILFSQCNNVGMIRGPIKRNEKMTLGEMIGGSASIATPAAHGATPNSLFYEVLDMSVTEFEKKRIIKCIIMDAAGKEHVCPLFSN